MNLESYSRSLTAFELAFPEAPVPLYSDMRTFDEEDIAGAIKAVQMNPKAKFNRNKAALVIRQAKTTRDAARGRRQTIRRERRFA